MDPPLDPPPPLLPQPTVALPFTAIPAANPTPPLPGIHNHPPYAEMIAGAISALNERDGSSKQAITKYIQVQYTGLPPTHSALLTHHIKRLRNSGQLVMVKNSYKLPVPGSVPVVASNGAVNAVPSDPASSGPAKRRGRPPKPKPELLQAAVAVPVFEQPMDVNAPAVIVPMAEPQSQAVVVGPVSGPALSGNGTGRGRGRPPKHGRVKRGRGRPPKSGGPPPIPPVAGGSTGRSRGRPKKTATVAAAPAGPVKRSGRPRGRPRRLGYVNEGVAPAVTAGGGGVTAVAPPGGVAVVVGRKRRGRPPTKAISEAKKPRKLSGKPVGRPKKTESAAPAQTPDSQLLVVYLDLKAKYENLQSRTRQAASIIKPYLNNETAFNALQELELLAEVNINAPSNVPPQPVQPPQLEMMPQPPQPVVIPRFQSYGVANLL